MERLINILWIATTTMPLHAQGKSKSKAFVLGAGSGAVEPVAALITILAAGLLVPAMPYLLSFAAGAMLYVVVEELIPEIRRTFQYRSSHVLVRLYRHDGAGCGAGLIGPGDVKTR